MYVTTDVIARHFCNSMLSFFYSRLVILQRQILSTLCLQSGSSLLSSVRKTISLVALSLSPSTSL